MCSKIHLSRKRPQVIGVDVPLDDMRLSIENVKVKAKKERESKILSWHGAYDLLIHQNGRIQFISTGESKYYYLEGEYLVEVE